MAIIQSVPETLNSNINEVLKDLSVLQEMNIIQSYLDNPDNKNLSLLKEQLTFFIESKRLYSQLTVSDEYGREIIKINYKKNTLSLVRDSDLSAPVLRFGIPLGSGEGSENGMIILNYPINPILNDFIETDRKIYLLTDTATEINSVNELLSEMPFSRVLMAENTNYQEVHQNGILTAYSFTLLKNLEEQGELLIQNIQPEKSEKTSALYTVISFTTYSLKFNFFEYQTPFNYIMFVFIEIFTAFLSYIIIRNASNRKIFNQWMGAFFQGIENNPASVVLTNEKGDIIYTNTKFLKLSHYTYEEIYRQNPRFIKSGQMSDQEYQKLWKTISSGDTWSGEFHNKNKDGNLYWVFTSISPIYNSKGDITNYLGIQEDISKTKEMSLQLEELAASDPLTGIFNRRSFFEKTEKERVRCLRSKHVFTILMLDIDHFKNINDTYGHQIGDRILKDLAGILKQNSREIDICARYGGEEFVITLPETELKDAVLLGNRLRLDIEQHISHYENEKIQITVSIGVSQWDDTETLADTIKKADILLYKAKANGRNRIEY